MPTELRVHGVSGSAAENVLDRPLLHRVAGDDDAGFLRPRPEYGASTGPGGADLEAYRWGNLTAGAAARALWLLLLPFMLANVTMWLRPPSGQRAARTVRALCRLLALSVTVTFVLAFVGASMDLIAWQCAGAETCTADRPYLQLVVTGFFAPTGRRLALLALVPLGAVSVLWFLGRRTWCRYEGYPSPPTGEGDGLAEPNFWNGMALVERLRAVHLAAGFATVDAMLLAALARHDRTWPPYTLGAATVVLLLACPVVLCLPGMVARDRPARWARPFAVGLRAAAVVLTVATFVLALLPHGPWPTTGGLPGYGLTVVALFAGQTVLLLGLSAVALAVRRPGLFLGGLGTPVLGSVAVGLATAFAAGMSYRVADFLDRASVPSPADFLRSRAEGLQPPPSYEWSALGFVATVVVVGVVLGWARLRTLRVLRRAAAAVVDGDFPDARQQHPDRVDGIDHAIADARLTDHSGRLLAAAFFPLAAAAMVVTGFALAGIGPVRLIGGPGRTVTLMSFTVNLGTYLIGLFTLVLLVLGLLAYRYQRIRRLVGVLWDLGTFWPRAAHPLAPPCYSERVVPELVTRAAWLAEHGGGVVLSGHSQGSVLVAATVLQLPESARRGTAVLTYGSPLRRLYAWLFPAYVDDATLARLGDYVTEPGQRPRWVNLWRDSDPIGGTVGAPADDVRLVDPAGIPVPPGDTVCPPVRAHSDYQGDPAFGTVMTRLLASLPPAPARRVSPDRTTDGAVRVAQS
jgi:hypothetical protein